MDGLQVREQKTPWGPARFKEIEPAPLFKFENKGQILEGVLVKMEPVQFEEKGRVSRTIAYFIAIDKRGAICKIHGTFDINQKMRPDFIGSVVRLTYLGEDQNIGSGGNKMRKFKVEVAENIEKQSDLVITDVDIGF